MICPFCNSSVSPEQPGQTGRLCPRCGELLPAHLVREVSPESQGPVPLGSRDLRASASPAFVPTPPTGWTNRQIGLAILGAMVLMAAIGLAWALVTVEARRNNDYRTKRDRTPPPTLQPPGDLAGLGFLPADANIVAALQVAELFKDPAGRQLLAAPRPALLDRALGMVEKWTGLNADEVDHIVLGTEIKGRLPQLTVVVETRRPYDPAALAKALLPARSSLQRAKPLFRFALQPGEGMLWCPRPRTLVLLFRLDGLKMEDLEAVPLAPRVGTEAAPHGIQDILVRRVNKQSLAWVVGQLDDPGLVKELVALGPLLGTDWQWLAKIHEFGLSLISQDGLVVDGHFRTRDENAAGVLKNQLEGLKLPDMKSLKVTIPPPGVPDPDACWVTLQMRGDPHALRSAIEKWGAGKER